MFGGKRTKTKNLGGSASLRGGGEYDLEVLARAEGAHPRAGGSGDGLRRGRDGLLLLCRLGRFLFAFGFLALSCRTALRIA